MAIATKLPEKNVVIRYPPDRSSDVVEESYQLLEIPLEILKSLESSSTKEPIPSVVSLLLMGYDADLSRLIIKGRPSDDAVLCTPTSTFLLRTVGISNSLLICRPPVNSDVRPTLEIRDISHEVLECVPQAANLERIRTVLKPSAWAGLGSTVGGSSKLKKRKRGDEDDGVRRSKLVKPS
jgi:sister chromatid cohesion protein DCC1